MGGDSDLERLPPDGPAPVPEERARAFLSLYVCGRCGAPAEAWQGECPECGRVGTLERSDEIALPVEGAPSRSDGLEPRAFTSLQVREFERVPIALGEVDRLLGGGAVKGHVALLSGEPGAGKTTVALEMLHAAKCSHGLFLSCELGERAVALYAKRLRVMSRRLEFLQVRDTDDLDAIVRKSLADVIFVDSLSDLVCARVGGEAGNPAQVKHAMATMVRVAVERNRALFAINHVKQDGEIAGPKRIQHNANLTLELLKKKHNHRVMRSRKSQQGPDGERMWFRREASGVLVPCAEPVQIREEPRTDGHARRRVRDPQADRRGTVVDPANDDGGGTPGPAPGPRRRGRFGP